MESQPAEPTDDAEARADFWSIQGDFIYRHHNEFRVQLNVPKEEIFLIPLKNDVTVSTRTDLDVLREKRLTIIGMSIRARICQIREEDSQSSLLKEKCPKGYLWSGRRLTKIQTTFRPDNAWREV